MNTRQVILSAAALIAFTVPPAFGRQDPTIAQRRDNQQARIAQGVKSGQLTAGETAHLERQQQSINREDARMRSRDNGKLTAADKAALNRRQNRASTNIYDKKHNARTRPS
jgi:hypothetical protein